MFFKEMLEDHQQQQTTTASTVLGKFDEFAEKACSTPNTNEPLASYQISAGANSGNPEVCAKTCLSVSGCTGFQILQLQEFAYCDLFSTCTNDRLRKMSIPGLSVYLLNGNDG